MTPKSTIHRPKDKVFPV